MSRSWLTRLESMPPGVWCKQHVDVDDRHLGVVQQVLVLGHDLFFEDLVDLGQQLDVEAGVAAGAQKAHHQRLDGRVGGAVGIGRHDRCR
jgi:hypothetical protein